MDAKDFPTCPICACAEWALVHDGDVRDGVHGMSRRSRVARCTGCGVERLAESACLGKADYESPAYRQKLAQSHDIDRHYSMHDEIARFTLDTLWPASLRGKFIADVGCGGGSLLDHLGRVPARIAAIDPDEAFSASLKQRGYEWHPSVEAAQAAFGAGLDIAFSIQVIEHVESPREFLEGIRRLLKPDGFLLLSTPNRADILFDLLPQDFPPFFYRTQHRWYFDALTLADCARRAGFAVREVRHVHRYGMANMLHWMRDRKPRGRAQLPPIDATMDKHWQAWLEANGRADNLYLFLTPAA